MRLTCLQSKLTLTLLVQAVNHFGDSLWESNNQGVSAHLLVNPVISYRFYVRCTVA